MERMSTAEFVEWMLYEQIEPFGERRADLRAGMNCATTANVHRTREQPYPPSDFMLPWEPAREKVEQTPEQQLEMMLLIQQMQNATLGNA